MIDDIGDASEAENSSGNEWHGDDEEDENENEFEGDEAGMSDDDSMMDGEPPSLMVHLKYGKGTKPTTLKGAGEESLTTESKGEADGEADDEGDFPRHAQGMAPTQTQETSLGGPSDTAQETPTASDSKGMNGLAPINTDVEEPKLALQDGPDVVI